MFWPSFTALLPPLWIYFVVGLIAVAILQTFVPPRDIARYLHGGIGAYLLAAVAGIPLYVCEEPRYLLPTACSKPAWESVRRSLSCSVPSAPASPQS